MSDIADRVTQAFNKRGMRYDYSQDSANEMLEESDLKIEILEAELAALRETANDFKSKWQYVEGLNKVLVEQSERRLGLLRELEWSESDGDENFCPYCYWRKSKGHHPDCALVRELADA